MDLKNEYPCLILESNSDTICISGRIMLNAVYNDVQLFDEYEIRMVIPTNYPHSLPAVYEVSGGIPAEFEHFLDNGALCLGVENDLWDRFLTNPCLLHFMNECVTSYLYAATYFKKYGSFPFGERSHGVEGIIEYYYEKWNLSDLQKVVSILSAIYLKQYRGHLPCPCGSGIKARKCHGRFILEAINSEHKQCFDSDLYYIWSCYERGKSSGGKSTTKRTI